MPPKPYLRRYQRLPYAAVVRSVAQGDGLSHVVMMARQAGKNETSAAIEAAVLASHADRPWTGIKAAPTAVPQAQISADRLRETLTRLGVQHWRDGRYVGIGRARFGFLSAERNSNVVGHTAGMLECDEAQDVDPDKWDKEFVPMGATTNATRVYYGTPWTEDDLLGRAYGEAVDAQRKDRRRRLHVARWEDVAAENPAYGRFVMGERDRLGANHPLFLTQFGLQFLAGAGRLLSAAQLAAVRGTFPRQESPSSGFQYVGAVDVAGEDPANAVLRGRDSTVMTIARLVRGASPKDAPTAHVVTAYAWKGTPHAQLYPQIVRLAESWGLRRLAIDSTAIGEALALLAQRALGEERVIAYRFTEASKSALGFGLQSAATTGRLQLWASDDSPEYREAVAQLRLCRAEYRPNRMLRWSVPATAGHDDFVCSLALLAHAAEEAPRPRIATMRK